MALFSFIFVCFVLVLHTHLVWYGTITFKNKKKSIKYLGFIFWGPNISEQSFMLISPVVGSIRSNPAGFPSSYFKHKRSSGLRWAAGSYMWGALWIVLPPISSSSSRFLLALEIISLSVWSNYRFNCWACSLLRVSVISTNTRGMKRRVSEREGYWVTCQRTLTRV